MEEFAEEFADLSAEGKRWEVKPIISYWAYEKGETEKSESGLLGYVGLYFQQISIEDRICDPAFTPVGFIILTGIAFQANSYWIDVDENKVWEASVSFQGVLGRQDTPAEAFSAIIVKKLDEITDEEIKKKALAHFSKAL